MSFYDVAIIGGGFSGTMTAVHLARLSSGKLKIALIDRSAAPALGIAYGTTDPQHLLNVRAKQMGAFADDPSHFWKWLQDQPEKLSTAGIQNVSADSFVPRLLYGQYLQWLLQETRKQYPNLVVVQDDVTDINKSSDDFFEIENAKGSIGQAKSIVLALGNFPPGEKTADIKTENPYSPHVWKRLAGPGDVLIIGTGLTSLDLVITLARTKKTGKIHLLSRRGLLPRIHVTPTTYKSFVDPNRLPRTALELYRLVKKQIQQAAQKNILWQDVIDAMRPYNQLLWEALNPKEQMRFLRFLRPYWDVHRHRCAPEVMDVYKKLENEGRILLHRGHIIAQNQKINEIEIIWRPTGKTSQEAFTVQQIVNCTGPQSDCRKLNDVLVQNLLTHNLIAPDPLRIGIATTHDYQVLDKEGRKVDRLYALGSLLKGRLYESVAVPELRNQARDVAAVICNDQ